MMKNIISLLLTCLVLASCGDKSDRCGTIGTVANSDEVNTLRDYIKSHSISAVEDSRGFFYTITNAGDDNNRPNVCSGLVVNYVGTLTNGSVFDSHNGASFTLTNVITGWQEGIPLIGKGGNIVLYLPPSLAYGGVAQTGIPANSILVFYVGLLDVK